MQTSGRCRFLKDDSELHCNIGGGDAILVCREDRKIESESVVNNNSILISKSLQLQFALVWGATVIF